MKTVRRPLASKKNPEIKQRKLAANPTEKLHGPSLRCKHRNLASPTRSLTPRALRKSRHTHPADGLTQRALKVRHKIRFPSTAGHNPSLKMNPPADVVVMGVQNRTIPPSATVCDFPEMLIDISWVHAVSPLYYSTQADRMQAFGVCECASVLVVARRSSQANRSLQHCGKKKKKKKNQEAFVSFHPVQHSFAALSILPSVSPTHLAPLPITTAAVCVWVSSVCPPLARLLLSTASERFRG